MKKIVVVSDLHLGSFYGLLPPNFLTFEGVPKLQNAGQEYLWKCWLDFVNRVEEFGPDFVVVNGDAVDGMQQKQRGAELSLTNWKDQRDACIATLKPLRSATRKARWFFTQGTPYHVGNFGSAEEDIAEAMDATPYISIGSGKLCREVLTMRVENVLLEFAHHISFSSVYHSTPLEKEAQATWMAEPTHGLPVPDLQVRSHVHNWRFLHHSTGGILTTPCWQLATRHSRKNSTRRLLPDIGGTYIVVDGAAKTKGGRCYDAWPEKYNLPKLPIVEL